MKCRVRNKYIQNQVELVLPIKKHPQPSSIERVASERQLSLSLLLVSSPSLALHPSVAGVSYMPLATVTSWRHTANQSRRNGVGAHEAVDTQSGSEHLTKLIAG